MASLSIALTDRETLKRRLGILHNDDDADLDFLIVAASRRIVLYLDVAADALLDLDSSGELPSGPPVPPEIEAATLYLAGIMWRNRDGAQPDFDGGALPAPVIAFLKPLREPPLA